MHQVQRMQRETFTGNAKHAYHGGQNFNTHASYEYFSRLDPPANQKSPQGIYNLQRSLAQNTTQVFLLDGSLGNTSSSLDVAAADYWASTLASGTDKPFRVRGPLRASAFKCNENRAAARAGLGTKATSLPLMVCNLTNGSWVWQSLLPARYTGAKRVFEETQGRFVWVTRVAGPHTYGAEISYSEWMRDFQAFIGAFEKTVANAFKQALKENVDSAHMQHYIRQRIEASGIVSPSNMQQRMNFKDSPINSCLLGGEQTVNATEAINSKHGQLSVSFGFTEPACITIHKLATLMLSIQRIESLIRLKGFCPEVVLPFVPSSDLHMYFEVLSKAAIMFMNKAEACALLACMCQSGTPCYVDMDNEGGRSCTDAFWRLILQA